MQNNHITLHTQTYTYRFCFFCLFLGYFVPFVCSFSLFFGVFVCVYVGKTKRREGRRRAMGLRKSISIRLQKDTKKVSVWVCSSSELEYVYVYVLMYVYSRTFTYTRSHHTSHAHTYAHTHTHTDCSKPLSASYNPAAVESAWYLHEHIHIHALILTYTYSHTHAGTHGGKNTFMHQIINRKRNHM